MDERHVTIRSVAAAAGVSMSTVSNVISGRYEQMAEETRERVLAAIERLNYQPNHVARSLVTKRTATIGLIMSEVTNSLYPPVTVGAEEACRQAGYGLLLANAEDAASERRGVDLMRAKRVDALVVFSISLLDVASEHLYAMQAAGMPVVAINRVLPEDTPLSTVWFDHRGGAEMATRHLVELGHRRIAHIAGPANRSTGIDRRQGYEAALTVGRHPRAAGSDCRRGLLVRERRGVDAAALAGAANGRLHRRRRHGAGRPARPRPPPRSRPRGSLPGRLWQSGLRALCDAAHHHGRFARRRGGAGRR